MPRCKLVDDRLIIKLFDSIELIHFRGELVDSSSRMLFTENFPDGGCLDEVSDSMNKAFEYVTHIICVDLKLKQKRSRCKALK